MPDRSVAYRFLGNFSNLTAGLATAGRNVTEFGNKLVALDRNGQRMRSGLTEVGNTAGKIGLVMAAGVAVVVRSAANFEQAMSNVQAATHETSGNMEDLRQAALDAGQATKFSATEAAGAIEELAKAGVSTADILGGGLSGALDLAAAGGLEVADAASIAATALTQFKLEGEDVPHVADLLAAAAGKAQGDVTDMSMALKQSGLVAAQMGLSIEETTGTLAAFASAGLLGSDAGTSFRTMLLRLANPTKESSELMEQLGIHAYDAQGQFVGIESLAGQLQTAFKGQSQATRDAALATIFGSDAIRAASVLYSQGADGVAEWTSKVDDQGYAAETAAIKMDNLKGDLEQLGGALETAFIGAGGGAQGPLRSLVQGVTDAVNVFNKLPGPVQSTATALAGITAVTGGALWFGSRAIKGIADTRQALQDLGIDAGRAKGALKAVGIAAGGLVVLDTVGAIIGELEKRTDRAVPGVEALTKSLLDLQSAEGAQQLQEQIGDLNDALGTINADGLKGLLNDYESFTENSSFGGIAKTFEFLGSGGRNLIGDDPGQKLREAKESVDALDEALANIATSGSVDQASAVFAQLAAAQGLSADEQQQLLKLLPQYNEAVDGAANAAELSAGSADSAASANDGLAGALEGVGQSANDAAQALQDQIDAMRDQAAAAIDSFDAITAYRQAMKDADKQAKDNNAGIQGNSKAALANRGSLSQLAGAWNNLDDQTKNANGAFKAARQNFIDTAVAMGVPKKAARDLADTLLQIPPKKVIPVSVPGADESAAKLRAVKGFLDGLRDKTIHVTTIANRIGGGSVTSTGGGHSDNEGPSGKKHARGGFIIGPGGPTDDQVPIRASAGEYVVRASSVRKYGMGMLDALNAGRYASGGLIASTYVRRSGEQDDGDTATGGAFHAAAVGAANAALRLQLLKDALDESKKSLDKETNARDAAIAARDAFDAAVGSAYSKADPFSGGLSGFDAAVAANTNDTQAAQTALGTAAGNGLDGALYQALATSGNLELLQEFAGLSAYQIDQRERQYAGMQAAQTALGDSAAATAGLDRAVAELSKQVREDAKTNRDLQQTIRHLEDALPKSVEKGAHSGTKSGTEGKNKNVAAQVWTQGRPMKGHHR